MSTKAIASSTPVGPELSRSQLLARADAICKRRNIAIDAVRLPGLTAKDIVNFASESTTLEQTAFTELGRLNPPASMAHDWQQILAYDRELLEEIIELGDAGKRRDTRAIPALSRSAQSVKRQLLATAKRDGFKDCVRLR